MKPDQIFPLDNEVAVKWSARAKGRNGRSVAFEGMDAFVVNEVGMIQSVKAYWNPAALMAELAGWHSARVDKQKAHGNERLAYANVIRQKQNTART